MTDIVERHGSVYFLDDLNDCPEPWRSELEHRYDEIERLRALRHAFRNADACDWSRLFRLLDDSAYGRFWTAVLKEAREALADD